MSRFKVYSPDQGYLLPPSVQDELSGSHLCFFIRHVVERLDLSLFEQSYSAEGGALHAPELMLSVWLYAHARRKATVEPVFGVLKQQRNLRQFRTRGLQRVGNEFSLATTAFHITRMHQNSSQ